MRTHALLLMGALGVGCAPAEPDLVGTWSRQVVTTTETDDGLPPVTCEVLDEVLDLGEDGSYAATLRVEQTGEEPCGTQAMVSGGDATGRWLLAENRTGDDRWTLELVSESFQALPQEGEPAPEPDTTVNEGWGAVHTGAPVDDRRWFRLVGVGIYWEET